MSNESKRLLDELEQAARNWMAAEVALIERSESARWRYKAAQAALMAHICELEAKP